MRIDDFQDLELSPEEQQELHSLEEQALFRAGLSMGLALGGRVRDLE